MRRNSPGGSHLVGGTGGEAVIGRGVELAHDHHVALRASDFRIPRGRITSVIGPNGSGKSTLLHAIAGLLEPRAGKLTVHASVDRTRPSIAYVLQATRVNESIPVTVREVVAMGRYARLGFFRRFDDEDRLACGRAMEQLEILDLASSHLDELSGGQRQRVFVAQGLAQHADVLLLDEPITGLDLLSTDRILEAIAAERERGVAIVMTTHDLGEAMTADHLLLLAGRVVAEGPPAEVLTPERLGEAYGVRVTDAGALVLDDPHHRVGPGRHVHFDRTGHEHPDAPESRP
ncbi:MAG: metal ABC transporter ATP-binding protein [Actinomycetota bacterium]